jgi:hypothetical protein
MDPLTKGAIETLFRDYGPLGVVVAVMVYLWRETIMAAIKPGDRTSPNEMVKAISKLTEAVEAQTEQFEDNNRMFRGISAEATSIRQTLTDIRIDLARGGK